MKQTSLAMWADDNGKFIIVGDEDCKVGDPLFFIPLTQQSVLAWVKALVTMLEDGEIIALPGDIGKCTKAGT